MQNAAVFDGESCELGISYQGPACLPLNYHFSQKGPVPVAGRQEAHTWLLKPPINDTSHFSERTPRPRKFGICGDAEKGCHTLPGQSNQFSTRENGLEPLASLFVMRRCDIVCVQENVSVENNHL